MNETVWVVHLDDAAPSSGFEGVCRTLEGAKCLVERCHEAHYADFERVHPTARPLTRHEIRWTESRVGSVEAYSDGRYWNISEEPLGD